MEKRFNDWMGIKKVLHNTNSSPPFLKEGSVWWCGLGENIGIEINGKGDAFSRPVVVYKKLGNESCMVIPMSSKQKTGS